MHLKEKQNSLLALYFSLELKVKLSKVISALRLLHLFLADGGSNLNPWHNIKCWLSVCVCGGEGGKCVCVCVWMVYESLDQRKCECFNKFVQPAVNDSLTQWVNGDARFYLCVFPVSATAAITYNSLDFNYAYSV